VFTKAAYDAFVGARSAEGVATITLSKAATEVVEKGASRTEAKGGKKKPEAPVAKQASATKAAEPETESSVDAPAATKTQPYGPGSKAPLKSGNAPKGHTIKGTADSKYHAEDSPAYEQATAEVWFDTVESAAAAGFTPAGGDDK